MSEWILVDMQNLPEFEVEVELISCEPNTGRQTLHLGYLSHINKKGPHFKNRSNSELLHITHWKSEPKFPKKIIKKNRKKF